MQQRSTSTGKDAVTTAPGDTNENHTSYRLTPMGEAYHQNTDDKRWWGRGAVKDPPRISPASVLSCRRAVHSLPSTRYTPLTASPGTNQASSLSCPAAPSNSDPVTARSGSCRLTTGWCDHHQNGLIFL